MSPYELGFQAFLKGESSSDNPYSIELDDWDSWNDGWNDAYVSDRDFGN